MKRAVRLLAMITAVILVLGLLSGCGGQGGGAGQADGGTLQSVLEKKKVVVGILPDFAPWGFLNAAGELEGYDVDLAQKLGEALDVEVELVAVEAPNRVPSLASNKVDVIIACLTPTNERAKSVEFTIPYASAGLVPMINADDDSVETYEDLAGKTVAIVRGGIPEMGMRSMVPDAELKTFDTIADAYTAFKQGQADAFVEEDTFVYMEVQNNSEYKAVGEPFSTELISIAVRQGDQQWLNYMNNFLTNLRFTGENIELYEKWFGQTPKPLELP